MNWKLTEYTKRTCGRSSTDRELCDVATFRLPLSERLPSYSKVCGKVVGYAFGGPDAFLGYEKNTSRTVMDNFVDGVVLYHGSSNDGHIWTFAAGTTEIRGDSDSLSRRQLCPCDVLNDVTNPGPTPDFVGDDYFCESQNLEYPDEGTEQIRLYTEDVLWDGENCLGSSNCCDFVKQLQNSTTDNIQASICLNNPSTRSDIAVEAIELYIHI